MRTRLECKRLKLKKPTTDSTEGLSDKDPAPRSPQKLKTPKLRRVGQQLVETPGRDDLIFSQHFDSQALVGWDCNSPAVLKGLRKETEGSDVTDLLKLIADEDECVDEPRPSTRSTPPLLGIWREGSGEEPNNNNNSSNLPSRQHRKGRYRKRSGKESAVSRDLFEKLSLALDQCAEVANETENGTEKCQSPLDQAIKPALNTSNDLFDSAKSEQAKNLTPATTGPVLAISKVCANKQPTRISPRLLRKKESLKALGELKEAFNCVGSCAVSDGLNVGKEGQVNEQSFDVTKHEVTCSELNEAIEVHSDEDWSDDDLFEEDSFIIKATQMPARDKKTSQMFRVKRKCSNAGDVPKSKVTRFSFQLENNNTKIVNSTSQSSYRFTSIQSKPKTGLGIPAASMKPRVVTQSHTSGAISSTASGTVPRPISKPVISKPPALPHGTVPRSISKPVIPKPPAQPHSIIKINDSVLASPRPAQNFYSNKGNPSSVTRNVSRTVRSLTSQITDTTSSSCSVKNTGPSISNKATTYNNVYPSSNIWPSTKSNQALNAQSILSRSNTFKKHNSFSATENDSLTAQSSRRRSISGGDDSYPKSQGGVVTNCQTSTNQSHNIYTRQSHTTQKPGTLNTTQSGFHNKNNVQARFTGNVSANNSVKTTSSASCSSASSPVNRDNTVMNSSLLNSTFDTSLSDELLCQLAEPDEFLDSQPNTKQVSTVTSVTAQRTSITGKVSVAVSVGSVCNNTGALTSSATTAKQLSNSTTTTNMTAASSSTAGNRVTGKRWTVANSSRSSLAHTGAVKGTSSTNSVPQPRQFRFGQRPGTSSTTQSRGCESVLSSTTEPLFAVPGNVVAPAKPNNVQAALNKCNEDLFDDDDDMLMSDDGLTEPQVLALLDEVELLATQQLSRQPRRESSRSSSQEMEIDAGEPVSSSQSNQDQGYGSSQELPNSQGECIARNNHGGTSNSQGGTHNSQGCNSNSQGGNSNSQGGSNNSQGGSSNSQGCGNAMEEVKSSSQSGANANEGVRSTQTKYSPVEIERKKQLALQKRLQRQNVHS